MSRKKGESESRYVNRRIREIEAKKKLPVGWKFNKWDRPNGKVEK